MLKNPAFLYGESIFVTLRVVGGSILYKKQQLERLFRFASNYYLTDEVSINDRELVISHLEQEIIGKSGILRVSAHAKERENLIADRVSFDDLSWSFDWRSLSSKNSSKLKTYPSPFTLDYPKLKMGSYMPHFVFKKEAISIGFDDALFVLNESIIEASTSNIFFGRGKDLFTPKEVIYPGLIREVILDQFQVNVVDIKLNEVSNFDFCFISNSAQILTSVNTIDDIKFKENDNYISEIKNLLMKRGIDEN